MMNFYPNMPINNGPEFINFMEYINNLTNKVNEFDNRIKSLENRISKLENNNDIGNNLPDDSFYMI